MQTAETLKILQNGTVDIEGLLPWSSNYAFLVRVCQDEDEVEAVYKPRRGERPLWDFPQGTLCLREEAAFLVSEALGWHLVPPTVLRQGQHGIGTVQLFIEHDPERHYFTFEGDPTFRPQLQRISLLDIIINNADRKGGHVLIEDDTEEEPGSAGKLWGIDHGICFHTDPKLRTVIWEFAGSPIPERLREDLSAFVRQLETSDSPLNKRLEALLATEEVQALQRRTTRLLTRGVFPEPGAGRHYPGLLFKTIYRGQRRFPLNPHL
ncbi:MAG: SCO1664 family protein [Chloroflexota bacterium]